MQKAPQNSRDKLLIFKKYAYHLGKHAHYDFFITSKPFSEFICNRESDGRRLVAIKNWPKIYSVQCQKLIEKLGHVDFLISPTGSSGEYHSEATSHFPNGKNAVPGPGMPLYNIKFLGHYLEAACINNLVNNDQVVSVSVSPPPRSGGINSREDEQIEAHKTYLSKEILLALGRGIRHAVHLLKESQERVVA